jgi:hypothetical protein
MRWVDGPKTLLVSTFRMKMSEQRWLKKEQNYVHIPIE